MPVQFTCLTCACRRVFRPPGQETRATVSMACMAAGYTGRRQPLADRFWAKVDKNGPIVSEVLGPCWLWTGATDGHGYGQINIERRIRRAHVVAYILTTGHEPPPKTPKITHLCDNGHLGCVRPSHLKADTQAGNLAGAVERGRTARGDRSGSRKYPDRRARGARNGQAKLTDQAVLDIRTRCRTGGVLQRDLAAEYGVSRSLIGMIAQGKGWPHLS
jgi:hypothetical protein